MRLTSSRFPVLPEDAVLSERQHAARPAFCALDGERVIGGKGVWIEHPKAAQENGDLPGAKGYPRRARVRRYMRHLHIAVETMATISLGSSHDETLLEKSVKVAKYDYGLNQVSTGLSTIHPCAWRTRAIPRDPPR